MLKEIYNILQTTTTGSLCSSSHLFGSQLTTNIIEGPTEIQEIFNRLVASDSSLNIVEEIVECKILKKTRFNNRQESEIVLAKFMLFVIYIILIDVCKLKEKL
ncbi:hypothetical protein PPL_03378 [Heterostelium album PN500]|uniref:Uncharacterized protein n=1 Tax=Heterostelium pallidum (strain ATCC 26659 / Pp 5 / PN500) TaxID=670386 RepID=D3B4Q3_HETP5|nr:hypothetical protein PPL_03378 [Heterostelium album PN500]EFA84301.1 hypothetical protein PPL_03378 [Heterostelium album PN500]|eukprot:XP_020436417.1 hypothetical protein PPL_03378 [Heterostelium album PN500]